MSSKSQKDSSVRELRDALAFAAGGGDKGESRERLMRAFGNLVVASLEEKMTEEQKPQRSPTTLHEQVMQLAEQAEQGGASHAKVVDELCWALGVYTQTRGLKQKSVVGTLNSVHRILRNSVLA